MVAEGLGRWIIVRVTAWDLSAGAFLVAFVVHRVRAAWRMEPKAPVWEKFVNIKRRTLSVADGLLLGGFILSLILGGNGDVLLHG